jgi:hypothetical protein
MKWNVDDPASHVGLVVVAFAACDHRQQHPQYIGPMRGYMPDPTVLIEISTGECVHWSSRLCRLATAEQAIAYWRGRAEVAELAMKAPR